MTKTEMLEILRGKVLQESPEEIQARLNEIADELEQSERVVRCKDCKHDGLSTCFLAYIEHHTLCFINRDADFFCKNGEREDNDDRTE